jgi:hypothetical protein
VPEPHSVSAAPSSAMFEQVPAVPGRLQDLHVSVQPVAQHTPSTQKLDSQLSLDVHGEPGGRRPMQRPPAQVRPAWHCVDVVQLARHAVASAAQV